MNIYKSIAFYFFIQIQTKSTHTHLCDDDDDEEEHICLLLVQNCLNKWFCFCHDVSSSLSMFSLHEYRVKHTHSHKIKQKDTKINLSANASFVCCCVCISLLKTALILAATAGGKRFIELWKIYTDTQTHTGLFNLIFGGSLFHSHVQPIECFTAAACFFSPRTHTFCLKCENWQLCIIH